MQRPENVEDFYPFAPLQEGLLFDSLADPESRIYFNQTTFSLRGPLNSSALQRAWQRAVERHPIIRTSFIYENLETPVQVVNQKVELPFEQYDWRQLSAVEQHRKLEAVLQSDLEQGFDFAKAPLMRLALVRTGADQHELVWSFHQILLDGWSVFLLLKEVFSLYESFENNQELLLEPPPPYRSYIAWLKQQDLAEAEVFWRKILKGFKTPTPLIMNRESGNLPGRVKDFETHTLHLSASATAGIQSVSHQHHLTLNTLVQGAWALLLSRYSGEKDIVFGTVVSGRSADLTGIDSMVGLFINTLPVRVQVSSEELLIDWLKKLQIQQVEARKFEFSPLVEMRGWSDAPGPMPLFESIVVFENYQKDSPLEEMGKSIEIQDVHWFERGGYPITVTVVPGDQLLLGINYQSNRFDSATIHRMLGHMGVLLDGMAADPGCRLSELTLLTESEKRQLSLAGSDTKTDYVPDQCIHKLFEFQALQNPDKVAVVCEGEQLTYAELNHRANKLAHRLIKWGVGADVLVAICVERSLEMIVGILGILKSGGAYVPFDPSNPKDRLAFMFEDASPTVLVTQQDIVKTLPSHNAKAFCIDSDWPSLAKENGQNPEQNLQVKNLAYVIYTSGSTGRPKGVSISHANVMELFNACDEEFDFDPTDVWTLFHSYAFDFSVWEIWGALIYGGRLVVVPYLVSRSPIRFFGLLSSQKVTVLSQTPAAFYQLLHFDDDAYAKNWLHLRLVIFGGESLEVQKLLPWIDRFGDKQPQLVNMYGITETTVHVTYRPLSRDDLTLSPGDRIGRPLRHLQIFLLDEERQHVPMGVTGEIFVGGGGVARGYLNRPELDADRFVTIPVEDGKTVRLYRSGDFARWREKGELEYMGRKDQQVKIRGFRIELGEIETVLVQHQAIRESVVLAREDVPGEKRLIAYVVSNSEQAPPVEELRQFLQDKLPQYMLPSSFVFIDSVPLTSNGKIDRSALPAPKQNRTQSESAFAVPGTPMESVIAEIWQELLNIDRVGLQDNFLDLGGHSLLAMTFATRLETATKVRINLRDVFLQTLGQLASACEEQMETRQKSKPSSPRSKPDRSIDLFYFGTSGQRLFGCYHAPSVDPGRGFAVVLCYPMGEECLRFHRAIRQLATMLSNAGFPVLRFDYYASGDSAGACEEGRTDRWRSDISMAIGEIKQRTGVERICLIGLRLGGALSMMVENKQNDIDSMVLWDPVVNGKAYLEEVTTWHRRMLQFSHVMQNDNMNDERPTEILGFPLTDALQMDIENIDLLTQRHKPANNILVIDTREEAGNQRFIEHLEKMKAHVDFLHIPTPQLWNRSDRFWIEDLTSVAVPQRVLKSVVSWVSERYP